MAEFVVRKGHDAWVYYETVVEAGTAEEAREIAGDPIYMGEWAPTYEVAEFDHYEIDDDAVRPLEVGETLETELAQVVVTKRQHATILAALRYWQDHLAGTPSDLDMLGEITTEGGEYEALDVEGIDVLCEAINS